MDNRAVSFSGRKYLMIRYVYVKQAMSKRECGL